MGFLVRFTKDHKGAFQALYEAFQISSRPKGIEEWRRAVSIDDKLISISMDAAQEAQMECPKCSSRMQFREYIHHNFWKVEQLRTLIDAPKPLFFEETAFQYLKTIVMGIQPPQPKVRDFVALWDLLEDAEKNWKGDEPELLKRLEPSVEESAKAESVQA